MKNIILLVLIIFNLSAFSQIIIKGNVKEKNSNAKNSTLVNANIYISDKTVGTVTDINGNFELSIPDNKFNQYLIASFIGYKSDSVKLSKSISNYSFSLISDLVLSEVEVKDRQKGDYISKIDPIQTNTITTEGLQKLACCNLSESFENDPTVDVSFSDAVTGAKQIQMLGLAGIYSQILTENIPSIRGHASPFGLGYIPGNWMESIQISKGTSSVINGYESITGQINIEYKKPEKSEKFFINLYGNNEEKFEGNINARKRINDKWSTMILLHAENHSKDIDMNHDSFLDFPNLKQINFMNRWSYEEHEKGHSQFGFKVLTEDRKSGQLGFHDSDTSSLYGIGVKTNRYEAFAKNGINFNNRSQSSIGLLSNFSIHEQAAFFGKNNYNATQSNFYSNLIYQFIVNSTKHKISTGASINIDNTDENLNDSIFNRNEIIPGAFIQYTSTITENLTGILGFRTDYHNKYGMFYTPRLHLKYDFPHNIILRTSAGRGYRVPNIIPENIGILASSRKFIFLEEMKPEIAWNYGINISKDFLIEHEEILKLNLDFYRTFFQNQLIVDIDKEIGKALIYNLENNSYSNSFQAQASIYPIEGIDITLAYRFNDVKMLLNDSMQEKPLVNKHKGLLSLSYYTKMEKWKFDITLQYHGQSRIAPTSNYPLEYQREEKSPEYFILHGQITRKVLNWDFYVGAENITNYTQKNPIVASDDPFGKYFDTSQIWGPIVGRMIYIGLRYKIE